MTGQEHGEGVRMYRSTGVREEAVSLEMLPHKKGHFGKILNLE